MKKDNKKLEKIVVIILTYNERENIGNMIEVLEQEIFPKIKKYKMEILVVDDKSPDKTAEEVRRKGRKYSNVNLSVGERNGLGSAFMRGVKYAIEKLGADAIIKMDADFQHDPKYIIDMVGKYDEGYDYVIGSRFIKGGSVPKEWGFYRRFLSKYGGLFTRIVLFFPHINIIKDVSSGLKLARVKGVLEKVDFSKISSGFYYTTQLLYQIIDMKAKFVEIPIKFKLRKVGETKMPFSNVVGTLTAMITLSLKDRRTLRLIKFLIAGFIGYIINALVFEGFFQLGISAGLAASIGIELAVISNFNINNIWTYRDEQITGFRKVLKKFLQFNLVSLVVIVISGLAIELLMHSFGDHLRHVYLILIIIFFILPYNYVIYNIFIWKNWKLNLKKIFKKN